MTGNTAPACSTCSNDLASTVLSSSDYELIEKSSALGVPFQAARQTALSRLGIVPQPTGADELWRFTKPDAFHFSRLTKQSPTTFALRSFNSPNPVNGVTLKTGAEAVQAAGALLTDILGSRASDLANDGLTALQLATVSSVALVTIPKNYRSDEIIQLSQIVSQDGNSSSLIIVSFEKGSSATILEDLEGASTGLLAPRVEVVVADNAEAHFCSVQRLSNRAAYYARHRFHTGRDAKLSTIHIALGAKLSRVDLDLKMYEPGADINLLGLYLVDGRRHTDMHPTQYHLAPHCRSDLFTKGVLRGESRSVYYGYIRVAEGAQKTDAYQTNRNLILSNEARADSIPNLEIKANDVRCSHGASVSHVSKEELFYLMTRGLSRTASEELLVGGFLEELLAKVKNPVIHGWLSSLVMEQLTRGR